MKLICAKDYEEMSRKAANLIAAQILMKPDCVLGLATGSTPIGIYKRLVEQFEAGDLDFSRVTTVNLDEYCGLAKDDPQSYHYFMQEKLFSKVNIDPERIYIPDGTDRDAERACGQYDEMICRMGGIDLQLLGLGHNGHIGFNEPGDVFEPQTHPVQLSENTMEVNRRFFKEGECMPTQAYTMGIRSIMQARKIIVAVSGADKAEILHSVICGKITPEVPASILQLHRDVTVVADEAAAERLSL